MRVFAFCFLLCCLKKGTYILSLSDILRFTIFASLDVEKIVLTRIETLN